MKQVDIRFYAGLNDFLPTERRNRTSTYEFLVSGSVKDVIEALGVPHTEVDVILANGQSVDFSYRVQSGGRLSVYPQFEAIDIPPTVRLSPAPLRRVCFILDTHLGRLAAYLRMVGFDTVYRRDYTDRELARISVDENRILLTRDLGLLDRLLPETRQHYEDFCICTACDRIYWKGSHYHRMQSFIESIPAGHRAQDE
jgi:hypothetical protein